MNKQKNEKNAFADQTLLHYLDTMSSLAILFVLGEIAYALNYSLAS